MAHQAPDLPSSWLGTHQSDPVAMRFAAQAGLCNDKGVLNDGLAYYRELTDEIRVWTRKSRTWRSLIMVPDGTVPVCYDPVAGRLVYRSGTIWKNVEISPRMFPKPE